MIIIYLLTVVILTWAAWSLLHYRWERAERARTVAGVVVVFAPAVLFALTGVIDLFTVLVVFAGFGAAGAVTVARDIDAGATGSTARCSEQVQAGA